jgi:hypothetical protein
MSELRLKTVTLIKLQQLHSIETLLVRRFPDEKITSLAAVI